MHIHYIFHYIYIGSSRILFFRLLQRFRGWHEVHPDVYVRLHGRETKGALQLVIRRHQQGSHGAVSRWPLSRR